MNTYIAFLRGINVSGQKKVPMATLRTCLLDVGLYDVETYIQSGNVVFKTSEVNSQQLELNIQSAILQTFGFEVPVVVKTPSQLQDILNLCPFKPEEKEASYFVLLYHKPDNNLIEKLQVQSTANDNFFITEACVYLHCAGGYGKSKLDNNFFERKLKTTATTRNYKTMLKLLLLCVEN